MCMTHCRAMAARQMLGPGGYGCHDLAISSDAEDHRRAIYLVRSSYPKFKGVLSTDKYSQHDVWQCICVDDQSGFISAIRDDHDSGIIGRCDIVMCQTPPMM